jgi:predicted thioesterase
MKKVSDVFKSIRYAVGEPQAMQEDLRNWFNPNHPEGDWKRVNSKGEVVGDCAREPGEPKPKCMSRELRNSLSKKEKASAVRRKREEDPNPERQGAPINVTNKVNEDMEQLDEKNKPTNPELWSRAIAQAKSKFDVYPSAYANGWASKWYKSKGGGWKTVSEAKEKSEYDYEGDMARGQLQSIVNNAQRVHDMLEDNDNLPEWVQSKITLAEDYISTVANYMMSEVDESVDLDEEMQVGDKVNFDHPMKAIPGKTMKKVGTVHKVEGDTIHVKVKDKYGVITHKKTASELRKEEVVVEEKGLWANIRAKRERIKNGSGERMRKPGSEGAPSEEILKKTQAIKEENLEEGRPSQRHPLEGHEYHKKTDAELVHIAKDAHKAAEAMKSHNTTAENKYRDQANDSATVRYYRQKNVKS